MTMYTKEDLHRLADFCDKAHFSYSDDIPENERMTYHDTVEELFEEKNDIIDIIDDFLGTYVCIVKPTEIYLLHDFLFVMPLSETFLYAGKNSWKGMIAKWRIELEK